MGKSSNLPSSLQGAKLKSRKSQTRRDNGGSPRKPKKSLKMSSLSKIRAVDRGERLSQTKPRAISKMSVSQNLMLRCRKPPSKRLRSSSLSSRRKSRQMGISSAIRISHQHSCQRKIGFHRRQSQDSLGHQKNGLMVRQIISF